MLGQLSGASPEEALGRWQEAIGRLVEAHGRLLAALAQLVEGVEEASGLPPLPAVPAPDPAADR